MIVRTYDRSGGYNMWVFRRAFILYLGFGSTFAEDDFPTYEPTLKTQIISRCSR